MKRKVKDKILLGLLNSILLSGCFSMYYMMRANTNFIFTHWFVTFILVFAVVIINIFFQEKLKNCIFPNINIYGIIINMALEIITSSAIMFFVLRHNNTFTISSLIIFILAIITYDTFVLVKLRKSVETNNM